MATPAQLAALAKARAARKKKKIKAAVKISPKVKRDHVKKAAVKRTPKLIPDKYLVKITLLKTGHVCYVVKGKLCDTDISQAKKMSRTLANKTANDLFNSLTSMRFSFKHIEVEKAKKPSAAYGKNPVPASKTLKQREAAILFEDFTGHAADHYTTHTVKTPDVGLQFGKCTGIMYETTRDGVLEYYCHEFKKSSRPIIGATHDGKQLLLVGGNYRFTNRGIVDN